MLTAAPDLVQPGLSLGKTKLSKKAGLHEKKFARSRGLEARIDGCGP